MDLPLFRLAVDLAPFPPGAHKGTCPPPSPPGQHSARNLRGCVAKMQAPRRAVCALEWRRAEGGADVGTQKTCTRSGGSAHTRIKPTRWLALRLSRWKEVDGLDFLTANACSLWVFNSWWIWEKSRCAFKDLRQWICIRYLCPPLWKQKIIFALSLRAP